MKKILCAVLLIPVFTFAGAKAASSKQPNIVLIVMDDLGWKDLSCTGSTFYRTPNIDRLAAQGVRFSRAYSAAPLCAPSRGAVLSGKCPARTCFIGKWHASRAPGYHPKDRGYDEVYALFNLEEDPNEQNDLCTSNPEVLARLSKKLNDYLEQVDAELPVPAGSEEGQRTLALHEKGKNKGWSELFKDYTNVMNKKMQMLFRIPEFVLEKMRGSFQCLEQGFEL